MTPVSKSATARWENEGGHVSDPSRPINDDQHPELTRYEIVAAQLTVYDWGGHRYSNRRDAVAAARRGRG